jgi:uncharacterized protein YdaU (DUF1376 family)
MNYFEWHISDYQRKTAHLSLAEHGAYSLMLQANYASERPLPGDKKVLYRLLRAESKQEKAAIDSVMRQFWDNTPEGLVNRRAATAIEEYRQWVEQQRANGRRGGKRNGSHGPADAKPSLSDGQAKPGDSYLDLDLRPPTKTTHTKPAEASLGNGPEGVGERKRFRTWQEIQAEEDARNAAGVTHAGE